MKRILVFKIILIVVLVSLTYNPTPCYSNNKAHKIIKKSKPTKFVQESLIKLKKYLIGFSQNHFDYLEKVTYIPTSYSVNIYSNIYLKEKLLANILLWLGTPYKMAGSSKKGIDCSNFVAQMIRQTLHINFPANAQTQSRLFTPIYTLDSLGFGDLLFFTGRDSKSNRIGHVGIYLGNGIFAHSSTGKGVIITHITEGYYLKRFRFGGRIDQTFLNIVSK